VKPDAFRFSYPDGSRDVETLMLDPLSQKFYLVSKREEKLSLYSLTYPANFNSTDTAELITSDLDFNSIGVSKDYNSIYYKQVVAGDISNDGKEMIIKTYSNVYYWRREGDVSIPEWLKEKPEVLAYTPEVRGEAITFHYAGKGYYTLSEEVDGIRPHLFFYKRNMRR
jgi:hypothetical protein